MNQQHQSVAIIGLGYVGLPLAMAFAKKYPVIGFDTDSERVSELKNGSDRTNEVDLKKLEELISSETGPMLRLTSALEDIKKSNIYIVTVPTPITDEKVPDLDPLKKATISIATMLGKGDIVIYESTVYPGCTEEECVPILEEVSGLQYNRDFFCGYSPERINPGDKINTLTNIRKVTSGSTEEIAEAIDQLYASIITAGTHKAPSIKVAEASKAIENAQRDLNISFMNELAVIFDKMGIDTTDVLAAAGTKWNFLNFKPGLVGGHCISVDPYYLAFRSQQLGHTPEVILSGRRINDQMGVFVADKALKLLLARNKEVAGNRALILGFSFKENCPDIRNTKVLDIVTRLREAKMYVDVYDPLVDRAHISQHYALDLVTDVYAADYAIVILAVAHKEFFGLEIWRFKEGGAMIFDTKSFLPRHLVDLRL